MRFSRSSAAALALSLPAAFAQTYTSCNPTEKTCPKDTGLNAASFSSNFLEGKSAFASWSAAAGTTLNYGSQGAEFSISAAGQAPTISTDFYFLFGRVDVKMRAAAGTGIVSSVVLLSDDLDEIDWEFLGGNTTTVETNFFGKGNTTLYDRATYQDVTDPQNDVHTYTIDWNSDRIEWIIDGQLVRTVTYNNALTLNGKNYPQTPMQLKLGNWCGGCSGESAGTVEWAGGAPNFSDGPFVMYVESVTIQNENPASAYEYVGESGSWESIKIIKNGGTTAKASGSATVSGGNTTQTKAPTKSVSVGHITNTAASNYTKTGTAGGVSTHTSYTTDGVPSGASATLNGATSATAGASASASAVAANSATDLAILTSSSLLALLCGFMLL